MLALFALSRSFVKSMDAPNSIFEKFFSCAFQFFWLSENVMFCGVEFNLIAIFNDGFSPVTDFTFYLFKNP